MVFLPSCRLEQEREKTTADELARCEPSPALYVSLPQTRLE
jgi:hypothetical protein